MNQVANNFIAVFLFLIIPTLLLIKCLLGLFIVKQSEEKHMRITFHLHLKGTFTCISSEDGWIYVTFGPQQRVVGPQPRWRRSNEGEWRPAFPRSCNRVSVTNWGYWRADVSVPLWLMTGTKIIMSTSVLAMWRTGTLSAGSQPPDCSAGSPVWVQGRGGFGLCFCPWPWPSFPREVVSWFKDRRGNVKKAGGRTRGEEGKGRK